MDITPYVEQLRDELANAAELGGADARALAERLTAPMESAFRLALLDALSRAADEITTEMAPGSVQVRLRDRSPAFVVTLPPAEEPVAEAPAAPPPPVAESDDAVSRINLRLPDQLKARIEEAASNEGLSVNAWLVRAASAAVQRPGGATPPPVRRTMTGSDRFTGWAR
ncbi:toxin-antitoxin system HicB family antitoxin [Actinoplanes sp. NPDC051470]|uniref:toxin-antitoxin system HicB family antitoxin n=1 Tax=unclassified Actinoplanes TaxID=2626549 RepID=UPI00343D9289